MQDKPRRIFVETVFGHQPNISISSQNIPHPAPKALSSQKNLSESVFYTSERDMEEACKRLWAAVLDQAVKEARAGKQYMLVDKARAWLESESQEVGSFLWICLVLNLDPQSIRSCLG